MAKRFFATDIWDEDWFLEMPIEYKLFWFYMLSACDHAGLFKVNVRSFCGLNEVKLTSKTALEHFNNGKVRIREVSESMWLIEDFFVFQYGHGFNPNNRMHESIENLYVKNKIELTSIRGLKDLKDRVKDKDKDITLGKSENPLNNSNNGKTGKPFINAGAQGENVLLGRVKESSSKVIRSGKENH